MALNIPEEQRKEFERFIKEHPVPEDYDPDVIVDNMSEEADSIALSYMLKKLLDGEIK